MVESNSAQFRLTYKTNTSLPIPVRINVAQTGHVLKGESGIQTITLSGNTGEKIINIATEDDEVDEDDGTITVTLLADDNSTAIYTLSADTTLQSASVTITDDDALPVYSIAPIVNSIVESNSAQFRLSSSTVSSSEVTVKINVSQTGNVIADTLGDTTTTVVAFATEEIIDIATEDDVIDEADGSITVTLLTDDNTTATYEISPDTTKQSAEVTVTDDDSIPEYSIAPVTSSVVEANPAQFRLTSPTASSSPVTVRVNVSQTGNVLRGGSGDITTEVAALASEQIFDIATEDDVVDESDGTITVTLLADDNAVVTYNITSNTENLSAMVEVNDDDENKPVVTLSSSTSSIEEGDVASISITLDRVAPAGGLNVNYTVSETGRFLYSIFKGSHQVTIPAGETTKVIDFKTKQNRIDEPHGNMTVSIVQDSSYSLGLSSSVSISINDRDHPPVINITSVKAVYDSDGAVAEFTLQSKRNFIGSRVINVSVTGVTSAVTGRGIPTSVVMEGNQLDPLNQNIDKFVEVTLKVPIHEDQVNQQTGQITATILAPTNISDYAVGIASSKQLNIADFDLPSTSLPVISIEAISINIIDGRQSYFFKISASYPSNFPLEINTYSIVSRDDNSWWGPNPRTITLPAGITVYELIFSYVPTYKNLAPIIIDRSVEIGIASGPGYYVAPSPKNSAKLVGKRYDAPAGISIVSQENISEENVARFQISASTKSQTDRTINVEVSDGDHDFLYFNGSTSVVLPAGENRVFLEFPLIDDTIDEPDGTITAKILPGIGYTIGATQNIATLKVFDNDGIPVIHLSPTLRSDWYAGLSKGISILTTGFSGELSVNSFPVNFRVTDGGTNIYNGAEERTLNWRNNANLYLSIDTIRGSISGDYGTISVEVLPGSDYEVSSTNGSADYKVYHFASYADSENEVSIKALNSTITEGQYALFQVTTSVAKRIPYMINYTYSDGDGNFIDEDLINSTYHNDNWENENGQEVVKGRIQFWNYKTSTIRIPTLDDNLVESDGSIVISLTASSTDRYILSTDSSKNLASVVVLDNDEVSVPNASLPKVSIAAVANTVVESNPAQFRLTTTNSSTVPILVWVNVSQSGNVLDGESGRRTIFIPALATEKIFDIATEEDVVNEPEGVISVTLVNNDHTPTVTYSITNNIAGQSAEVAVSDNDAIPVYSITARSDSVSESQSYARFTISSPTASSEPITLRINLSQRGNVRHWTGDWTTTIRPLVTERPSFLTIHNDEVNEPDGAVIYSLLPDDNIPPTYRLNSDITKQSAEVTVIDDDPIPEYSIATVTSSVVEANPAQFRITSPTASSSPVTVRVNVSQTGNVLSGGSGDITTEFSAMTHEQVFDIATEDDMVDESDGTITVTLLADDNTTATYTLNTDTTLQSAEITVTDDDSLPVYSIAPVAGSVVESNPAQFRISSPTASTSDVTVRINVSQSGNVLSDAAGDTTTTVSALATEKIIDIATEDDVVDESDGTITVTLLADDNTTATYTITSTTGNQSAEVEVTDDDEVEAIVPVVTLSSLNQLIREGYSANLRFTLDSVAPESGLRVKLSISQIGNYLNEYMAGIESIIIPAGESSKELSFKTSGNYFADFGGSFTVSINPDSAYTLGTTTSVTVNVIDTGNTPVITMTDAEAHYERGGAYAYFYLESSELFSGTREINVSVSGVTKVDQDRPIPSKVVMDGTGTTTQFYTSFADSGAILKVPIHTDQIFEDQINGQIGQITATILAPSNSRDYRIGSTNSRQLSISSFGLPPSKPLPEISVSAVTRNVHGENQRAFKISASHASQTPLKIRYRIHYSETKLDLSIITRSSDHRYSTFTLVKDSTHHELLYGQLMHKSTNVPTENGQVEFYLLSGDGYIVADNPRNYATISRRTDNKPDGISIASKSSISERYGQAIFQITASNADESDRIINVDVTQGDNDFLVVSGPTKIVLPANQFQTSLSVPIVNDEIDEPEGFITATILPGTGYTVASTKNVASIKVRDDDGTPVISLAPELINYYKNDWVEGEDRPIQILTSRLFSNVKTIKFRVTDGGSNLYDGTEIRTINSIFDSDFEAYLRIETHDDDIEEDDGTITIELLEGDGYEVSASNQSVSFTIKDNDITNEISIQPLDATITEGQYAQFQFNAAAALGESYKVIFEFDDGESDFIGETPYESSLNRNLNFFPIEIGRGQMGISIGYTKKLIRIPTVDDNINESDGRITLTILENSRYPQYSLFSDSTKNSASITVLDNDSNSIVDNSIPTFSIAPVVTSVVESNPVQFRLTTPTASASEVNVKIFISQTGNFLVGNSGYTSIIVPALATEKIINIATKGDLVDEGDGEVRVRLLADDTPTTTYSITTNVARQSAKVTVTDDDQHAALPVVILSTSTPTITEGETAKIRFALDREAPINGVRVSYSVNEIGSFLNKFIAGTNQVVVPAGKMWKELNFYTTADLLDEPDGNFTVTLNSDSAYTLSTSSTVTVNIKDSLYKPTISITGARAVYYGESAYAEFTLQSSVLFAGTRTINVSVAGVTRTIADKPIPNAVSMDGSGAAGRTRITPYFYRNLTGTILQVPIHEDQVRSQTGQISVTILAPTNEGDYRVGYGSSRSLDISNFDLTSATLPVMSAFPVIREIDDEKKYFIRISSSHASTTPITINYRTFGYGNWVEYHSWSRNSQVRNSRVTLPAGAKEYEISYYSLETQVGKIFEFKLLDGTGYLVAQSPNDFARIDSRHNSEPNGISIVSEEFVFENDGPAKFQIVAATATESDRIINVEINEDDSDFLALSGGTRIVLPANETYIALEVPLVNDYVDESDGVITATLLPGSGYSVATKSTATLKVLDDDGPALVSLPPASEFSSDFTKYEGRTKAWIEGQRKTIKFSTVGRIRVGTTINFRVTDGESNLYRGAETRTWTWSRWPVFNQIEIDTSPDNVAEENGTITIEVLPGNGYQVSPTYGRVTYTVLDDDSTNEVSVQALDSIITEGQYAQFQIKASKFRKSGYSVKFSYDDGDGNFIGEIPNHRSITDYINFSPSPSEPRVGYTGFWEKKSKIVRIPIFDDKIVESNGLLTLTLNSGNGYTLNSDATKNTASVTILDDDSTGPTLTIEKVNSSQTSVVEGSNLEFRVLSSAPVSSSLVVNVNLTQFNSAGNVNANFIDGSLTKQVTIARGSSFGLLTVSTQNDNVDESDGRIYAAIQASSNFRLGLNSSTNIVVTDDDALPMYSIAPVSASVVESNPAQFRVTSPTASSSPVTVRINIAQTGNVLSDVAGDTTTTVSALAAEKIIDIATEDDEFDEADGTITVTLLADDNTTATYTLNTDTVNQSAEVAVTDDDEPLGPPVVNLSTSTPTVNEGEVAKILFTLDRIAPINGLQVSYSIDENGNYLDRFTVGTHQVLIPAGQTSKEFKFKTINDYSVVEPDGSFTISLSANSSYVLGETTSVTVNVQDINGIPSIKITEAKAVNERGGTYAEFYLQSSKNFTGSKSINVSVTGVTGIVQGQEVPSTAVMEGTGAVTSLRYAEVILRVPIHEDQINSQTGQITATILAPSNASDYAIGTPNRQQLSVSSFDLPSITPLPEVSVSAISRQVFGEEKHYFKFSISRPPDTPITINYQPNYTETSLDPLILFNYYFLNPTRWSFTLPAGMTHYELASDDLLRNEDYLISDAVTVELSVLNGLHYYVAPSPGNFAKIELRNENVPVGISILGEDVVRESSGVAKFRISASTVAQTDRIININVSDGDSDFIYLTGASRVVLPAGKIQTLLQVPVENDNTSESEGFITVTILPGTGYNVASVQNVATTKVLDDDGTPLISLYNQATSHSLTRWTEGESWVITILKSRSNMAGITAKFRVSDGGDNLYSGSEIRFVSLSRYRSYDYLRISTIDDNIDEVDGEITVEILPGTGYEVSSTFASNTYTVYDDDEVNHISIQPLDSTITEGQYAQFELRSAVIQEHTGNVYFNYDDGSGDFLAEHSFNPSDGLDRNINYFPYAEGKGNLTFRHRSEIVRIPTLDDNIDESDGRVTLTITAEGVNTLFSDPSKNTASVIVLDNDDTPTLSIASVATTVVESNPAQFRISSPTASILPITVRIRIAQTGSFLSGAAGDITTILPANNAEVIFDIATEDDVVDELDGVITATLLADDNTTATYTLNFDTTNQSAEVSVTDDDALPVYSIAPVSASIVESNPAQFRLTSPTASSSPVTVRINVSQTGNVLSGSAGDTTECG